MAAFAKITFTFLTDSVTMNEPGIGFYRKATPTFDSFGNPSGIKLYQMVAVPAIVNPTYQYLIPTTTTSTTGEALAISYYNAISARLALYVTEWTSYNYSVTQSGNQVVIQIEQTQDRQFEFSEYITGSVSPIYTVAIDNNYTPVVPVNDEIIAPEIENYLIEIYDTSTSTLVDIEEITQLGSPKLSYEGGDDIDATMMASSLSFNMLVPNAADAHFLHLLSGNENKYLVQLHTVNDASENKKLIWQGYLLPDQYKEPWRNGALFVEFTATDRLATLKAKNLKPWYYQNRLPLGYLLATILQQTGLNQKIIVAPSIVPALGTIVDLNFPLSHYVDDNKYEDSHTIIADVLESLGLTLYSYMGYFFLMGISRKREVIVENAYMFLANGTFEKLVNIKRKVVDYLFENGSVLLNAETPYKEVVVDFSVKGEKNLFTQTVVSGGEVMGTNWDNQKGTWYFETGNASNITQNYGYRINANFPLWERVGNLNSRAIQKLTNDKGFIVCFEIPSLDDYATEAEALNNYFKAIEVPGVLKGIAYEISFKVEAPVKDNEFDWAPGSEAMIAKAYPFQIYIDGELDFQMSPNHSKVDSYEQSDYNLTFKINYTPTKTGNLEFRLLDPIVASTDPFPKTIPWQTIKLLKISSLKDFDVNKKIERAIDFTTKKELGLKFVSTCNENYKNNIGIGAPVNDSYFYELDRSNAVVVSGNHKFMNADSTSFIYAFMSLNTFDIPVADFEILSVGEARKKLFIVKDAETEEQEFASAYFRFPNKIGFLKTAEDRCKIPEGYKKTYTIDGLDVISYMDVKYGPENKKNREYWKIVGTEVIDTFVNQLARVHHYTKPYTHFSLETNVFGMVFPNDLVPHYFNEETRNYFPTRLDIDLSEGQTAVKGLECVFEEVTDIVIG